MRALPAAALARDAFGPPAPPLIVPLRRRAAGGDDEPAVADGPFAALATLRR